MEWSTVTAERREQWVVVTLNRPQHLNAIVPQLPHDLLAALDWSVEQRARAVILHGAGRAFCAGADLKEGVVAHPHSYTELMAEFRALQALTRQIRAMDAVIIAAVKGYALGAGAEIALSADVVIAGASACFGFPETSVGLPVTGGITALLPHLVGLARAKELLLLGHRLSAQQAYDLGLVNLVVEDDNMLATAASWAEEIAGKAPLALAAAKHALDDNLTRGVADALEDEIRWAFRCATSEDAQEGPQAFQEKRQPEFHGR
jgi:2-(1,2-epoxy-1,2-dihydrophenyl)acetyl-CoA isomerase